MFIKKTKFKDLCIITQKPYYDNRGFFVELFNKQKLKHINFVIKQVNFSFSKKNVFRGMHFQITKPQSKIIGVIEGEIEDYVIDLRKKSKTYKKLFKIKLSSKNKKFLLVPKNFAHGFFVKSKFARIVYFVDEYRYKKLERTLSIKEINKKFYKKLPKNLILSNKDK